MAVAAAVQPEQPEAVVARVALSPDASASPEPEPAQLTPLSVARFVAYRQPTTRIRSSTASRVSETLCSVLPRRRENVVCELCSVHTGPAESI